MTVTKEVKLHPFAVPDYVFVETPPRPRQEGFAEGPKFHLKELSEETLNSLCDNFRKEVFRKSGYYTYK